MWRLVGIVVSGLLVGCSSMPTDVEGQVPDMTNSCPRSVPLWDEASGMYRDKQLDAFPFLAPIPPGVFLNSETALWSGFVVTPCGSLTLLEAPFSVTITPPPKPAPGMFEIRIGNVPTGKVQIVGGGGNTTVLRWSGTLPVPAGFQHEFSLDCLNCKDALKGATVVACANGIDHIVFSQAGSTERYQLQPPGDESCWTTSF